MENNDDFQPASCFQHSQEEYGRPKKQQKYVSGENNGKWSQTQHTKYIAFIQHNKEKMRSKEKRRVCKLYKEMAMYIRTRNAFQCRSHHQKLEDRHYFPNKIIAYYKKHNDLTLYNQCKLQLEEMDSKVSLPSTLKLKLQEKNVEYASQTEITRTAPVESMLAQEHQTPSSSASNELSNTASNATGYLTMPVFEPNPFWGSYFFYPYYLVN